MTHIIQAQWLIKAYELATQSPDPSTQNGAIIVNRHGVYSTEGYNTFPNGVAETPERLIRPKKYNYIEHAERDAIYRAAKFGIRTLDTTLYCPWFACYDCARAIICSGIAKVVGHQCMYDETPERWKTNVDEALDMLREAGVEIVMFQDPLPTAPKIRFNGELWQP
ncbi:MAG: CMP deaminase [Patescibacteria group bacterium]|nr:CMP deaminase [Patescibacteria group bacterium]MDE2438807.1 CMP deaminase [Patescibacteria group bacterium]